MHHHIFRALQEKKGSTRAHTDPIYYTDNPGLQLVGSIWCEKKHNIYLL